jgi:hypothetical protein
LARDSTATLENYDRVRTPDERCSLPRTSLFGNVDDASTLRRQAFASGAFRSMKDDIEIFTLDQREQWTAAHRDVGFPSQSWQYAWALSAAGIAPKLAVVRSGGARMLLPFFEREWQGTIDIATILGAAGASISGNSSAPLSLWREHAIAQGWVAGYIQLSTSVNLAGQPMIDELVEINEWFELDLQPEATFLYFSENIRRKIKSGYGKGIGLAEDAAALAEALKLLLPIAMERVSAGSHYFFPDETLQRWVMDTQSLVLGASVDGVIEAVALFVVSGDQAEYHLSAGSDRGRDLAAWLIWNAIVRLKLKGIRTLHLGGGVRRGDGLHNFKQKFRGTPKAQQAVRQIYDQSKYEELCRRAGVPATGDGWFPAYRVTRTPI